MYLNVSVYHGEYNVDGDEGPRASNASATVDHHRPGVVHEMEERYILQYIKQFNIQLLQKYNSTCNVFDHDCISRDLTRNLRKSKDSC